MRQFKIIDTNPSSSGLITANFAMPVIVPPGCCINLDKFAAQIPQSRSGIELPTQIFQLSTDVNVANKIITIPGAVYATTEQLLKLMNQLINNSFIAETSGISNNDLGLKYTILNVNNRVNMNFVSVFSSFISNSLTLVNCSPTLAGIISPTATGEFGATDEVNTQLKGGGYLCEFVFRPDRFSSGLSEFRSGIISATPSKFFGIRQLHDGGVGTPGTIQVFGNYGIGQTLTVDAEIFYPGDVQTSRYVTISQTNGFFTLRIWTLDGDNKGNFIAEYITTMAWNIELAYSFQMLGERFGGAAYGATTAPGIGFPAITIDAVYPNGDAGALSHLFEIFFVSSALGVNANALRQGLGVTNIVTLAPTNFVEGEYIADATIDFSIIRGSLDIAIEILDFPIETYQVGASQYPLARNPTQGQRQPGARVNVLAYFSPLEDIRNPEIYTYAQSSYQWLDLANKQALEFTSLNFRVFVASTGQPLTANQISFNFLIKDVGEKY
jgi:hypothetical protein